MASIMLVVVDESVLICVVVSEHVAGLVVTYAEMDD